MAVAVAMAMAMAIIINENNTIQFNFPDSVKVDPLYEFNSLPGDYSPIDVIMKYSHKGFHTKFKLFYKDGVLTLELYLPKPTGHCFEHNFLVASLDVTSISGDNYPLTDEVIFFGFQDIEYEREYNCILSFHDEYHSEGPYKYGWDKPRSDYENDCEMIRAFYVNETDDRLFNSPDFNEILDVYQDAKYEIKYAKKEFKDDHRYKVMKRVYKTLRLCFDETKIISGYRLYNYIDEIKFWQFLVLKIRYNSKEIMSYSDFRDEFYEDMGYSMAKTDEYGEDFGGFWDSTNETLRDKAFDLQMEHNCKKLYQLPYPHKLLLLAISFEGTSLEDGGVRYVNFICYMVETLDNIMIKQYFEALEAIKHS